MRTWKWVTRMLDVSCFWQRCGLSSHIMSMLISSWQDCKFLSCELFFCFLPRCVWVLLGFSATRWWEYTGVTGVMSLILITTMFLGSFTTSNFRLLYFPCWERFGAAWGFTLAHFGLCQQSLVHDFARHVLQIWQFKYRICMLTTFFCACFLSTSSGCPSNDKINT